jgi:hypothetical protein
MTRVMTMTLHAAGVAGADDAGKMLARATFTLRRGVGFAIAAGGIAVLILEAIVRLHGG